MGPGRCHFACGVILFISLPMVLRRELFIVFQSSGTGKQHERRVSALARREGTTCSGKYSPTSCPTFDRGVSCPGALGTCSHVEEELSCPLADSGYWQYTLEDCEWFQTFRAFDSIVFVGDSTMRGVFTRFIHQSRDPTVTSPVFDYNYWACASYRIWRDEGTHRDALTFSSYNTRGEIFEFDTDIFGANDRKIELHALYIPAATYDNQLKVLCMLKADDKVLTNTMIVLAHQMWEVLDIDYKQASAQTVAFFDGLEGFVIRNSLRRDRLFLLGTPRQHMPSTNALRVTKTRNNFARNWAEFHNVHFIDQHRLADETEVIPLVDNNWHHMYFIAPEVLLDTRSGNITVFGREDGAECDDPVNLAIIRELFVRLKG